MSIQQHSLQQATVINYQPADAIEYALDRPEQFTSLNVGLPEGLARLQRQGLVNINTTNGYMPVHFKDGNVGILPVQSYDVQAVGKAY